MTMLQPQLLAVFMLINLVALLIMLIDKLRSRQAGTERISEGMLFFLATMLGSLGVYAGMFLFRHKTRKWYFLIGIPFLLLQNISLLYVISLLWP
jgi:uncharacterized membrane protein YsdA (DUF1294 family)